MNKMRVMFFVLLGAFGFLTGLTATPAFAVEKDTTTNVTKGTKVDVNHATEEELQELPGIGEVYAKKIIAGRPYKTEADLVKSGIPQNTVDKIKDKIRFGKERRARRHTKKETTTETDTSVVTPPVKKETKTYSTTKTDTSNITPQVPPKKGMVWVNTESMVYHTEGDPWYGKTKNGKFMDEKDAIKFGARRSKQD